MSATPPPSRLLTPAFAGYLLADILALFLIVLGGAYLITGTSLLPGLGMSFAGALLAISGGFVLMFWALARILVAVATQAQLRQNAASRR